MIKKIYYAVLSLTSLAFLSYLIYVVADIYDGWQMTSAFLVLSWIVIAAFVIMVIVTCYNVGNLIYDYLKKKKSEETKTDTKDKTEE